MEKQTHFGIYAVILDSRNNLTTVKKTRGNYEGLYCLPGGSPEDGETSEETLHREIGEELGAIIEINGDWIDLRFHVKKDGKGNNINFTHTAKVVKATIIGYDKTLKLSDEDTSEIVELPINNYQDNFQFSALIKNALNAKL